MERTNIHARTVANAASTTSRLAVKRLRKGSGLQRSERVILCIIHNAARRRSEGLQVPPLLRTNSLQAFNYELAETLRGIRLIQFPITALSAGTHRQF